MVDARHFFILTYFYMMKSHTTEQEHLTKVEHEARELADTIARLLSNGAREEETRLHELMTATGERAREQWEKSQAAVREAGARVDTVAREHVWQAVGIAALVGVLLGGLFSQRYRKS